MSFWTFPMLIGKGVVIPPSFVSSATGYQASGTATLTINKPASVAVGDLLVAIIWGNNVLAAASLVGWSPENSDFTGSARHAIFTRTVTGSEGSSFGFSTTSTADKNGAILAYRNASSIQVGTKTQAGTNPATAASMTAADAGILLACFAISSNFRTVSTPPTSMTQRAFVNNVLSSAVYDLDPSPAGATPAKTLTWSFAASVGGIAIQVY